MLNTRRWTTAKCRSSRTNRHLSQRLSTKIGRNSQSCRQSSIGLSSRSNMSYKISKARTKATSVNFQECRQLNVTRFYLRRLALPSSWISSLLERCTCWNLIQSSEKRFSIRKTRSTKRRKAEFSGRLKWGRHNRTGQATVQNRFALKTEANLFLRRTLLTNGSQAVFRSKEDPQSIWLSWT